MGDRREPAASVQQMFNVAIVIASDGGRGQLRREAIEDGKQRFPDRFDRHGAMDDVAEQDQALRFVIIDQRAQAFCRGVARGDGHQLARMAVRPRIPEVQVRNGEESRFGQP
jgi:hypothetical protein